MAGRYDDIPCLISTINRACYRVVLHKDPTLFGRVSRWAPLLWACFGGKMMIEPVDSGKIHQNPLPVQIPNPFFGSWCFKRSHFYISLHRGSQVSLSLWRSVMARSSSIVAPLLVLASVALAVPLAAHLDIARSDEILPRAHLQNEWIHPILSQGFYGDVRGIHPTWHWNFSVHKWSDVSGSNWARTEIDLIRA